MLFFYFGPIATFGIILPIEGKALAKNMGFMCGTKLTTSLISQHFQFISNATITILYILGRSHFSWYHMTLEHIYLESIFFYTY